MEVEDLGQHISRRFNEDLESVRSAVLKMGGLVEAQFDAAVKKTITDLESIEAEFTNDQNAQEQST